jgi:outer membrane PBP1 activator LpoA protein
MKTDWMECQNSGPSIRDILAEPAVVAVEGYIVTQRSDARVTIDAVYLASDHVESDTIHRWINTANRDSVETDVFDGLTLRRMWWD